MNRKLAITKKRGSRIFNRAPTNFWEPEKVEEDSTTKNNFYKDSICYEVKYNPTTKKSDTYKNYIREDKIVLRGPLLILKFFTKNCHYENISIGLSLAQLSL
jgi:hypothetical protein